MAKGDKVPVYRHGEPPKPIAMASYECKYLEDIEKHIAAHIGPEEDVLHEIVSPTVHVDIHIIPPNKNVPYLTIVTSGMSDLDMAVPQDVDNPEDYRLAEIIAFLPPDWPIPKLDTPGYNHDVLETNWHPFRWLKHYARMPHEYQTFLTWCHTSANGQPAAPICDGVGMVGFLFAPALQLGPEGLFIPTHDGRKIRLLSLVPIWPDEVVYAVNRGGEALGDKLDRAENFVFDPARQSCLKRKKLFGLF
jgi:Suppressor of fused protein (SUFU)